MAVPPAPARTRLSVGRAIGLYAVYTLVFAVGGGIGAGLPSFFFSAIAQEDTTQGDYFILYAIMFGVTGYIAYQLARRVAEG